MERARAIVRDIIGEEGDIWFTRENDGSGQRLKAIHWKGRRLLWTGVACSILVPLVLAAMLFWLSWVAAAVVAVLVYLILLCGTLAVAFFRSERID